MRTRIFSLLILLSGIIYAQQASQKHIYTPLSTFDKDTIQYLRSNFEEQSKYFKGKKLEEVFKSYRKDLPINFVSSIGTSPFVDPKNKCYMKAISIAYYPYDFYYQALGNPAVSLIFLNIYFAKPWLDEGEYWRNMPDFDTDEEEVWYMKDLIVDDIEVVIIKQ